MALFRLYQRTKVIEAVTDQQEKISYRLTTFPQGIIPVEIAASIMSMIALFGFKNSIGNSIHPMSWRYFFTFTVILFVFNYLFFVLFGHEKRIQNNLFGRIQFSENLKKNLIQQMKLASVFLILISGIVLLPIKTFTPIQYPQQYLFSLVDQSGFQIFSIVELIIMVVVFMDLVEEWNFRKKHGQLGSVLNLDNVYFAEYSKSLLKHHGIDCFVQAHRYRSLYFFFQPLVKMNVYVPSSDIEKAEKLIRPNEIAIA